MRTILLGFMKKTLPRKVNLLSNLKEGSGEETDASRVRVWITGMEVRLQHQAATDGSPYLQKSDEAQYAREKVNKTSEINVSLKIFMPSHFLSSQQLKLFGFLYSSSAYLDSHYKPPRSNGHFL